MTQEQNQPSQDNQPLDVDVDITHVQSDKPGAVMTIESVEMMAKLIGHWHMLAVARAQQMLDIPENASIQLDGKDVVLTGDARTAFIGGVTTALHIFGNLPIVIEYEKTEEQPTEEANEQAS